jgi:hypothetical protein
LSDPADDRTLEDYLHRKSALSMGYRRVYVEAPPPELDRAVTARARRALRWIVPGILAVAISLTLILGINVGVGKWVVAMKGAEKNLERLKKEHEARVEAERTKQPVALIDAASLQASTAPLPREQWLAKIKRLRAAGKNAEADAEQKRLQATYPTPPSSQ